MAQALSTLRQLRRSPPGGEGPGRGRDAPPRRGTLCGFGRRPWRSSPPARCPPGSGGRYSGEGLASSPGRNAHGVLAAGRPASSAACSAAVEPPWRPGTRCKLVFRSPALVPSQTACPRTAAAGALPFSSFRSPTSGSQSQDLKCACVTRLPLSLLGIVVSNGLFGSRRDSLCSKSWRQVLPAAGGKVVGCFSHPGPDNCAFACMSLWGGCLTIFQSWKNISSCVSPEAQVKKKTCEALVDFRAVYSSHFLVVAKTLAQKWKGRVRNVVQKAPGFQGADSSYFIPPSLELQEMSLKFRDFLQSKRKPNQTKPNSLHRCSRVVSLKLRNDILFQKFLKAIQTHQCWNGRQSDRDKMTVWKIFLPKRQWVF